MFSSLLTTSSSANLSTSAALILLAVSLLCGCLIAVTSYFSGKTSRSFTLTLLVMPLIVMAVIMVVNGNLGAGVAAVGAFSLIRFRSVPGTAREICLIFLAMAAGLALGMGYAMWAVLVVVIVCAILLIVDRTRFGQGADDERTLRITVPEDLDFTGLFDEVLQMYTLRYSLESVKTTSMGSLFDLNYQIVLKEPGQEKEFIDALRCLNANLPILCAHKARREEL